MIPRGLALCCAAVLLSLIACGGGQSGPSSWTPEQIHAAMREVNPDYNEQKAIFQIENGSVVAAQLTGANVTDISPLAGMSLRMLDLRDVQVADISALEGQPLVELYLEGTQVKDLTPLDGAPLRKLYLSNTPVTDLSPLEGSGIIEMNLLGAQVTDLSPLSGLPLQMLWLNDTPVTDITPLRLCPLVSLTLEGTNVADISPLAISRTLQRLHIAGTLVTDLSPLAELQLTRLIFTPSKIEKGIEVARQMASLQEIGTTFENRMPPAQFWALYDRGEFR